MPKPFMPGSGAYVESPSSLGDVILRVEHTEGDRKVYDLAFDDSVLRRPDFVEQIKKEISKVRPGVTWMSLSLILNGVTLDNAMSYDDVKQVSSCDPLMWVIEMSMVAIKAPGSIFCQRPKERKTYINDIYKILDDFKSKILTVSSETSSHAVCLAEQLHQKLRTKASGFIESSPAEQQQGLIKFIEDIQSTVNDYIEPLEQALGFGHLLKNMVRKLCHYIRTLAGVTNKPYHAAEGVLTVAARDIATHMPSLRT